MSTRGRDVSEGGGEGVAQNAQMKVRWDDSNMKSTYANVCNVAGTREEIVLLFGMNQPGTPARRKSPCSWPTASS